MARYEAGETLSSIARTYDCSPPAISYVVNRSRARRPSAPPATAAVPLPAAEPQLIKTHAAAPQTMADGGGAPLGASAPPAPEPWGTENGREVQPGTIGEATDGRHIENWRQGAQAAASHAGAELVPSRHAMSPAPVVPTSSHTGNGSLDHRPKLHLSLGNDSRAENGSHPGNVAPPAETQRVEPPRHVGHQPYPPHRLDRAGFGGTEPMPHNDQTAGDNTRAVQATGGFGLSGNGHSLPSARHDGNGAAKEGTGAFIDRELRARVDTDIAAFLAAFDAALTQDSQENRSALREATDRLLRAGARTRIELERLDARMPLPRRDPAARRESSWHDR